MKANKYIVWAVVILPCLMLLASGIFKLFPTPEMQEQMKGMGHFDVKVLAVMEITFTILYLVPATRRIGFYFLASYLGGAMAVHIGRGEPWIVPAGLLAALWVGGGLSLDKFLSGVGR